MYSVESLVPGPTSLVWMLLPLLLAIILALVFDETEIQGFAKRNLILPAAFIAFWTLSEQLQFVAGALFFFSASQTYIIMLLGSIPLMLISIIVIQFSSSRVRHAIKFIVSMGIYLLGITMFIMVRDTIWDQQIGDAPQFSSEEKLFLLSRWSLATIIISSLVSKLTMKLLSRFYSLMQQSGALDLLQIFPASAMHFLKMISSFSTYISRVFCFWTQKVGTSTEEEHLGEQQRDEDQSSETPELPPRRPASAQEPSSLIDENGEISETACAELARFCKLRLAREAAMPAPVPNVARKGDSIAVVKLGTIVMGINIPHSNWWAMGAAVLYIFTFVVSFSPKSYFLIPITNTFAQPLPLWALPALVGSFMIGLVPEPSEESDEDDNDGNDIVSGFDEDELEKAIAESQKDGQRCTFSLCDFEDSELKPRFVAHDRWLDVEC
jgi:hypothetical protein